LKSKDTLLKLIKQATAYIEDETKYEHTCLSDHVTNTAYGGYTFCLTCSKQSMRTWRRELHAKVKLNHYKQLLERVD
jgi:hypothetical protein